MIYYVDAILAEQVFKKLLNIVYRSAAIILIFLAPAIVHYIQIKQYIIPAIILAPTIILLVRLFKKQFVAICKMKNAMIFKLEVTPDQYKLETFPVYELWGLYRRDPYVDALDRKKSTLVPHPEMQLSKADEYKETVYQLVCDGKGYWIEKNFFEKFVSLKFDLTSN